MSSHLLKVNDNLGINTLFGLVRYERIAPGNDAGRVLPLSARNAKPGDVLLHFVDGGLSVVYKEDGADELMQYLHRMSDSITLPDTAAADPPVETGGGRDFGELVQ